MAQIHCQFNVTRTDCRTGLFLCRRWSIIKTSKIVADINKLNYRSIRGCVLIMAMVRQ